MVFKIARELAEDALVIAGISALNLGAVASAFADSNNYRDGVVSGLYRAAKSACYNMHELNEPFYRDFKDKFNNWLLSKG